MNTPAADLITIVDAEDNVIGAENRRAVRQKGLICRIVRIIINNSQGQILVQQRAAGLTDNPLKWDWSATGHVDAGEEYEAAALRETAEEVGITGIQLNLIGKYYDESIKGALTLRRFNSVYQGQSIQQPHISPGEVAKIRWVTAAELMSWLASNPQDFTPTVSKIIELYGPEILRSNSYRESVDHSASN